MVGLYAPGRKQPIASSAVQYGVHGDISVEIDFPDPLKALPEYPRVSAMLAPWLGGRGIPALPAEERAALPRISGVDEILIDRLAAAQARAAELATLLPPVSAPAATAAPVPPSAPGPRGAPDAAVPPPGKASAAAQVAAAAAGVLGRKASEELRRVAEEAAKKAAEKAAEELRRAAEEAAKKAAEEAARRARDERPALDLVPPLYALIAAQGDVALPALLLRSRAALKRELEQAAKEKVVAPLPAAATAAVVDALIAGRDLLHFNLDDDGRFADAKAIAWAPVEPALKSRLLDAVLEAAGSAAALDTADGLTATQKSLFGEIFDLFAAVGQHAPMLAALSRERPDTPPIFKRGGAGLDQERLHLMSADGWSALVKEAGAPAAYRDKPDAEANFAGAIAGATEAAAPGRNLAARLAASTMAGSTALAKTLAAHPDFNIRTQPVQGYFTGPGMPEAARPNNAQLGRLAALQRTLQIAPNRDFAVAEALIDKGYTSGYSLLADGKAKVQQQLGPSLGLDMAQTLYRNAQQGFADAYAIGLIDRPDWTQFTLRDPGPAFPNLTTLFGNADFCSCAHCQSVYGPAAYLADLLHWMRADVACLHDENLGSDSPIHSAYDELARRRPEIPNILLNCGNANTAMPYIDIVIEVLSYAMLPAGTGPKLGDLQTHGDTGARLLEPEYRTPFAAADALLLSSYVRWELPYDPIFDEARACLDALGRDHSGLVEALSAPGWTARNAAERTSWACARFGLIPEEFAIITTPNTGAAFWKTHWGLNSAPGAQVKPLLDTGEFADLAALEALLRTEFVRGVGRIQFTFDHVAFADGAPCDIDQAKLAKVDGSALPFDVAAADRAMRFERLRRRSGLTVAELDRALAGFGGRNLDSGFVCSLAAAAAAAERLGKPIGTLLGWFDRTAAAPAAEFAAALRLSQADFDAAVRLLAPGPTAPWDSPDATLQLLFDLDGLSEIPIPPAELSAMLEGQSGWALDTAGRAVDRAFAAEAKAAWEGVEAALLPVESPPAAGTLPAPDPARLASARAAREAAFDLAMAEAAGLPPDTAARMIGHYQSAIAKVPSPIASQPPVPLGGGNLRQSFQKPRVETPAGGGTPAVNRSWGGAAASDIAPVFTEFYRYLLRGSRLMKALGVDSGGAEVLINYASFGGGPTAWNMIRFPVVLEVWMNRFGGVAAAPLVWTARAAGQAKALDISQFAYFMRAQMLQRQPNPAPFGTWALDEMGPSSILSGLSAAELQTLADQAVMFETGIDPVPWTARLFVLRMLSEDIGLPFAGLLALAWSQLPGPNAPGVPNRFSAGQVAGLRGALKAAAGDAAAWTALYRRIQDRLRRNLRDALVAYYLGQRNFADIPRLYAHFLLDPEMEPCMTTSRIVQATNACQTLIQRGLLGLEPEVCLDEADKKEWVWRKNYRVWEANRKVFVYPENWIVPSLRLVKTPFFAEAQEKLLQDELNAANVEKVFNGYLSRLQDVSRLDIRGVYYDDVEGVSHVFGRTWNPPFAYFYRRREANQRWTAWDPIEIDIQGDHLIPVMFNRRLYLFWPTFTAKEHRTIKVAGSSDRGAPYVEIRLCYSKLEFGKWAPKKQYDKHWRAGRFSSPGLFDDFAVDWRLNLDQVMGSAPTASLDPGAFYFWAETVGGDVVIHLRRMFDRDQVSSNTFHLLTYEVDFAISGCDERLEFRRPVMQSAPDYYSQHYVARPYPIRQDGMQLVHDGRTTVPVVDPDIEVKLFTTYFTGSAGSLAILGNAHFPCMLTYAHQDRDAIASHPFFLADRRHTHFITHVRNPDFNIWNIYLVDLHEHPHCCLMLRELHRLGVDGLLAPKDGPSPNPLRRQQIDEPYFLNDYQPSQWVLTYPTLSFDFEYLGAYSAYNWEIFFHLPALIGHQLRVDGKHAEALRWLSFIFDPTNRDEDLGASRFWMVKPFHEHVTQGSIDSLMRLLQSSAPQDRAKRDAFASQIAEWRKHPFEPHAVAEMRIQAYMRWTVMEYVDTLIDWGDKLFRQDSRESVNEALQLYMLASEILGPRPRQVEGKPRPDRTFLDLLGSLDAFSNAAAEFENSTVALSNWPANGNPKVVSPAALYFCIPENPQLLAYWDRVADRLFKIRHCRNIEGEERDLALFAPPIDPALLVRAVASGLDLSDVLDSVAAPSPRHRFSYLVQRATDFCNDVKSLGAQLLAALEKRDAEELGDLRQVHELNLLGATRALKKLSLEEAKQSLAAAEYSKKLAETRFDHYSSREFMIAEESTAKALTQSAHIVQLDEQQMLTLAAALGIINFQIGSSGNGVHATFAFELAKVPALQAQASGAKASAWLNEASRALTAASYVRRQEDWTLQAKLASQEVQQADKQIAAAEIRVAMAEKELDNHDLQVEQSKAVHDWMRSRFTNEQLYGWMSGKLKSLHRNAYKLAFDLAKQAQQAFQIELGRSETYVAFGAWDSTRQGLLAGEALSGQLRELEAGYMRFNTREFELSRSISLRLLAPEALIDLRATGRARFEIPEWLLATDFADSKKLYAMRIKSVALSLPCVTGPYTPTQVKLRLLQSAIGWTPGAGLVMQQPDMAAEIITSTGVNDPAMFDTNLRDERYLPFENAGAVSEWEVSLPKAAEFDYQTISDLILHVRFVAKGSVGTGSGSSPTPALRAAEPVPELLMSWRHDFPDDWTALLAGQQINTPFPCPAAGLSVVPYRLRLKMTPGSKLVPMRGWKLKRKADGSRELGPEITFAAQKYVPAAPVSGSQIDDILIAYKIQ
ncbi:MAG TPA: neuraminidase-like domain-containing protein [Allosphingosinicella sp.]|nr:neuraminidase-like domain-containing protein [Allosphingosinicella sp.]